MCTQDDIEINTFSGGSYIVFLFFNIAFILINLEATQNYMTNTVGVLKYFLILWAVICLAFGIVGFVTISTRTSSTFQSTYNNLSSIVQTYYGNSQSKLEVFFCFKNLE